MDNEYSLDKKERQAERSRTWEGRLGKRHFRLQWNQQSDAARLHFQAPFTTNEDPDGVGTPFTPDLGIVWERGRGTHAYGKYAERLGKLQSETAVRVESALEDLELALAALRKEWSKRRAALQPSQGAKGTLPQRVRIEFEEEREEPLDDEDSSTGSPDQVISSLPINSERETQRRAILEALRIGSISLEEAELQLDRLR